VKGSILDKNNALLFKWSWRFGSLGSGSWKNVICNIHNLEASLSFPSPLINLSRSSWSNIINVCFNDEKLQNIVQREVCILIGNGRDTSFWHDV